jgi:magnesium transporter
MKLLTIITTIFIPLSFIAGVYGMNFHNMPELTWHNGYYGVLSLMGGIFLLMIIYFRYKKWF